MWPFKKKLIPMCLPQTEWEAIKPSDSIIYSIATGDYRIWLFPYQYVNWAAEQLELPKKYNAAHKPTFGDAVMIVNACKEYIRYKSMVATV